jgi:hypothetical protein
METRVRCRLAAVAVALSIGFGVEGASAPLAHARPALEPTYAFGSLQAGQAAYIAVMVGARDQPTSIEAVELSNPDSPFWIEGEDCLGEAMDVNDVCVIGLVFQAPDVDGDFQDTLTVRAADGEVATSMLHGTAYRAGGLTAEPGQVDWINSYPTRQVILRNRTAGPLWIGSVVATPPFSVRGSTRCSAGLYRGETCSISVLPARGTPNAAGTLTIRHAPAYSSSFGSFTPGLPFSTLSIPLTMHMPPRPTRGGPPASPKPPTTDYGSIEADLADLTDAVPRLIRGGPTRSRALPALTVPTGGRLTLTLFGWSRQHRMRIGSGASSFAGPSTGRLRFRLNERGVALLRRPQRTRIKVVMKFEHGDVTFRQGPELVVKAPLVKPKPKRKPR